MWETILLGVLCNANGMDCQTILVKNDFESKLAAEVSCEIVMTASERMPESVAKLREIGGHIMVCKVEKKLD